MEDVAFPVNDSACERCEERGGWEVKEEEVGGLRYLVGW